MEDGYDEDDLSSASDIDDEMYEDDQIGGDVGTCYENQGPGSSAAPPAAPPAGSRGDPRNPPAGVGNSLGQSWSFGPAENDSVGLTNPPTGPSSIRGSLAAGANPPAVIANPPPAGSSFTQNPPADPRPGAVPSAGLIVDHLSAHQQLRIDLASATRTTDRIQTGIHGLSQRVLGLEQAIVQLTQSFQAQQADLAPAMRQFARAADDQETFVRAVLSGHDARRTWQTDLMREINRTRADQDEIMATFDAWDVTQARQSEVLEELSAEFRALEGEYGAMRELLSRFVSGWDLNRHVVDNRLELILSYVSWLEPYFFLMSSFWRILRSFMFWGGASGSPLGPPPGLPPGGEQRGDQHGHQGGGHQGGGRQGGDQGDDQQAGGDQASDQQDDYQPRMQYGLLRPDSLPYQPYRPSDLISLPPSPSPSSARSSPDGTEGFVDSRARLNANHNRKLLYFVLVLALVTICAKIILPHVQDFRSSRTVPTLVSDDNGEPYSTAKASAPSRGAWLKEPVMKALFEAKEEAKTVAALTAQSIESVTACAKLVESATGKQDWYGKWTKDEKGVCAKAVNLAVDCAEKVKGLAGRLDWVFGEKSWATVTRSIETNTAVEA